MKENISKENMRLDRFLGVTGVCSRSEAKKAIRRGAVTVNGVALNNTDAKIDPEKDRVCFAGKEIIYRRFTYIMMNKPSGVVSATEDGRDKTVIDLLPDEARVAGLFPCGRLDKNTLGLVMITNDGALSHRLLSPSGHVAKKYRFESKFPVRDEEAEKFELGVEIGEGYITKPAKISLDDDGKSGYVTIIEGKYHQIKLMFEAINNQITYLERVSFGSLELDSNLERGEWRYLTDEEISKLGADPNKNQ